jgi:lipopolysaccharide/colanic/teichoic acid biosynthesis glycosyltransferase
MFDGLVRGHTPEVMFGRDEDDYIAPPLDAGAVSPFKYLIDAGLSLCALIILSPLLLAVAIAIKLDSPGPVFFTQQRNGKNGKVFRIYKFRSMRHAAVNTFKQCTHGDSRVTRLGQFLRKSSIDELPQLINIVKGDMAIVGPRPHALEHDKNFEALIESYSLRYLVRPGLTGLAQVRGLRGPTCEIADMEQRLSSDLEYVKRWSLLLDFAIIAWTIPSVLKAKNAL